VARRASLPGAAWRGAVGKAEALEALNRLHEAEDAYDQAERLLDSELLAVPWPMEETRCLGRERGARLLVDLLARQKQPERALQAARRARTRVLAALRSTEQIATLRPEDRATWDKAISRYWQERAALDAEMESDWNSQGIS